MRAIDVAPVVLLGAAAYALTAPAATAYAEGPGGASSTTGYTVTPSVVAPGSQVVLAARGCSATATAGSGVFDTVTIPPGGTAAATVDRDARPGVAHEVTFICDASPAATVAVAIVVGPAPGAPATAAAVRGGRGGDTDRTRTAEVAAGTAAAVVTATAAVHVVRHRKESRPR
ncbi:hypothetical protein [Streptomyces sp. NPDC014734]|uniref:hypothetical protein n=1 Tax=Streptomyces sp. NPDC014734 TaxID=3364886 RepID=UPI0036F951F4